MEQSNYGFRSNNERSITLDIEEISPDTNNEGISDSKKKKHNNIIDSLYRLGFEMNVV